MPPPAKVRKVADSTTVAPAKTADVGSVQPPLVSSRITRPETANALAEEFSSGRPFPHLVFRSFLSDPEFCRELREELLHEDFHLKSNDLYEFYQTHELNTPQLGISSGAPGPEASSGDSVLGNPPPPPLPLPASGVALDRSLTERQRQRRGDRRRQVQRMPCLQAQAPAPATQARRTRRAARENASTVGSVSCETCSWARSSAPGWVR